MYNYERIHQKSRDLANKMIQAYVKTECLKTYTKNKRQLLLKFEEFHRTNMIDGGLNPEEYENIVDTAIKLFKFDISEILKFDISEILKFNMLGIFESDMSEKAKFEPEDFFEKLKIIKIKNVTKISLPYSSSKASQ